MSQRLTYIEIDLLKCSLNYGTSPCTAAIGVTGEKKCFNSKKTCQDRANFAGVDETLRLAVSTEYLPPNIEAIPNITGVSYTPSRLDLGASIGARSVLTVNFHDHPSPDTGAAGDPYPESRSYDAYKQGSFWGKFKARQPYLRGRELRWYNGKVGDSLDGMEIRTFVIDRIEGPDAKGNFRIIAKDPLTLIDDKRAQAPALSRGSLATGISASATSLTLSPAGVGADYPISGKVAIGGNEIVSYTRSGDVMTITRAQMNTEAQEHDEDDRVQWVLEYTATDPADLIYNLLTTYGNIPASYINLSNWQSETSAFLGRVYTGTIAEPTSVTDLINEILEQAAISVWWSETQKTIRLQVLRNLSQSSQLVCDDLMLAGSFKQKEQPNKRVSQVWTYYGQINPLESLDDPKNYRNTLRTISLQSEDNYGTPSIKQVYSRWITQFGRTAAERLNNLVLSRYSEPPRVFTFAFLRDSGVVLPQTGAAYNVCSFMNQDDEGNQLTSPCQAIQVKVSDAVMEVEAEEVIIGEEVEPDDPTVKVVPIDADAFNFNFRQAFLETYAEANEGDTVICSVRNGVVVSSTSTSLPAFDTGTGWPSGITLKLDNSGIIAGKGGKGGTAARFTAGNGESGGLALLAQSLISVNNVNIIGGGGGGGGGARSTAVGAFTYTYSGGGGGGGFGDGFSPISGGGSVFTYVFTAGENGSSVLGGNVAPAVILNLLSRGGKGGDLGQSGEVGAVSGDGDKGLGLGGQAGNAIEGESLITWINEGDIRGNRV
jgi:hypothetical protein